jgi:hypothetical protein
MDGFTIIVHRENRSPLRGKEVLEQSCAHGTFLPACTDQHDGSRIKHFYQVAHAEAVSFLPA